MAGNLRLEIALLEEVEILPPKLVDELFGTRELAEAALEGGRRFMAVESTRKESCPALR